MNPAPTVSVGAGSAATDPPNPNHPEPSLRTLPFSSIKVYKNGELLGTVRKFRISVCLVDLCLCAPKRIAEAGWSSLILLIPQTCPMFPIATEKELLTPKSRILICWHFYRLRPSLQIKLAQERVSMMAV